MSVALDTQRILVCMAAGKRAVRVAEKLWRHDPWRAWRAHLRAQAFTTIAERRTEATLNRYIPKTELQ